MAQPTDRLVEWASQALSLGFDCISEGEHSPFALVCQRGTEHLVDFKEAGGNIDEALVNFGKDIVKRSFADTDLYAIVWDGYLTADGERREAVFAEAGERGKRHAFTFAQVYHPTKRSKSLKRIGPPFLVGSAEHLFNSKSAKK